MPYDVAEFKIDPLQLTTPRARLEYLRDFLRALPPERFDVSGWFTGAGSFVDRQPAVVTRDCGTAACVAGWTWALFLPRKRLRNIEERAAGLLGLSEPEAIALFYPPNY